MNVHNDSWRAKLIVRRVAAGFAAALLLALPWASPVDAAGCNGGGHTLSLSAGKVSPGSGTTSTGFAFSVFYKDSGGCAPDTVTVHVNNVGTFGLSGSGTNYAAGVTFSKVLTVGKPGTFGYSFYAKSGSKEATLKGVTPSTFTVSAGSPTPPPPPPATPKPTAPPPPPATPKPTAPPPPPATPKPTAAATSTPPATTPPTASPTGDAATATSEPSGVAVIPGSTGSSPSPAGEPVAGSRGTPKPQPGAIGAVGLDDSPVGVVRFATWLAITAGGLGLFLLLARRPREEEEATEAAPAGFVFDRRGDSDSPTPEYLQTDSEGPSEEANMPRWLRPSVQSARRRSVRD